MNLNLLDLVSNQGNDELTGLIEDVVTYAPEFSMIPVVVKDGTSYKIVKRTALPSAQFRAINNGVTAGKSAYKQEVKEMFFLDCQINVDEAIVQGDDESSGGDILTKEALGELQNAIVYLGAQVWYGTSNDAAGFQGIRAQVAANVAASTGANTTSAYLLWLHNWGVNLPIGKKGQIAMKPWNIQQIAAPTPGTGNIFAYVSNLSTFIGLTVGSNYSAFAVTGLSGPGSLTNQLTDKLGLQLISYVPLMRRQGLVWFLNRNAYFQLQQSRTTVNVGTAGAFYSTQVVGGQNGMAGVMPLMDNLGGYPIVQTDSITNTESN